MIEKPPSLARRKRRGDGETTKSFVRMLAVVVASALSLGAISLVSAPAAIAEETSYPPAVAVTWTNLSGSTTKPITATVKVSAMGGYTSLSGNVQICEDTRCYGNRVALNKATGVANLSAIVPRDASGYKSLHVTYTGGTLTIPGSSLKFSINQQQSDTIEAKIAGYPVAVSAKLVKKSVKRGTRARVKVTLASRQPKILQWVSSSSGSGQAKSYAPKVQLTGTIEIRKGKKLVGRVWVKNKKSITVKLSSLGKGTHKLTVKYTGGHYHKKVTTKTLKLKVK